MRYNSVEERFFARLITKTSYEARQRRKINFDVDLKCLVDMWNLQGGLCALTHKPMALTHGGVNTNSNPEVCTMDRKDPSLGYTKDNIQLVRWRINRVKGILQQEEFIAICKDIVINLKEKNMTQQ
jgi:hypothetical protein